MAKLKMADGTYEQPKRRYGRAHLQRFKGKFGVNPWNWTHFIDRNLSKLTHSKTREIEVWLVSGDSIILQMDGKKFLEEYSP